LRERGREGEKDLFARNKSLEAGERPVAVKDKDDTKAI